MHQQHTGMLTDVAVPAAFPDIRFHCSPLLIASLLCGQAQHWTAPGLDPESLLEYHLGKRLCQLTWVRTPKQVAVALLDLSIALAPQRLLNSRLSPTRVALCVLVCTPSPTSATPYCLQYPSWRSVPLRGRHSKSGAVCNGRGREVPHQCVPALALIDSVW